MSSLQTTPNKRRSSGLHLPYPREWFVSKTLPPNTITTPCIVEYSSAAAPSPTTPTTTPPPSSFLGCFPPATATPAEAHACLHLRIGLDMTSDYDNDADADTSAATPLLWLRHGIATEPAKGAAPAGVREVDEFVYLVMPLNRFCAAGNAAGSLALTRYDAQPPRWRVPRYVRDAMGASAARLSRADMGVLELALVRAPLGLVAGRWMRCAAAVDEGLVRDVREVQACTRLRVHVAWTRELERMVEALGEKVEEAAGRGDGEEACPLVKGRRVMGCADGERVAVNGWGNFLESGRDEVTVVDHKVSSNAERDGLVMTSEEFAEVRKRKRAEEREKARASKKAKAEKEARADARAVAEAEKSEEVSKKKKTVEVFKKKNTEDMDIAYD